MKYYRDEQGNLYQVDRETGEKTLVEHGPEGAVSTPDETTEETQED